jgi:phage terminase large subunit
MYLYRELYVTQTLVEDLAAEVLRLSARERHIEATVCDHDAEDRATLERHGVPTVAAVKDVSPGIQAVKARLRRAGDGRPRLFVLQDALVRTDPRLVERKRPTCTVEEFPAYVWPKARDGALVKEQPVKDNDHGLDALRYGVMYLDSKRPAIFLPQLGGQRVF